MQTSRSIIGVRATGTLTITANPLNTETVVLNGKTYTFQTTLTNVDGNIQIGATAADSLANLIAAINLGAGAGTAYAAATTLHPTISAAQGAGLTATMTAKQGGTGGNALTTTETLSNGSFGGGTLSGGGAETTKTEFEISDAVAEVGTISVAGTFTGSIELEGSNDGVLWKALEVIRVGDSTVRAAAITTADIFRVIFSGLKTVRLGTSAWTTGTAEVNVRSVRSAA